MMVKSGSSTAAITSATEDQTYYTPIVVSAITADRISCMTGSTFTLTGSCAVRLGIYNNDAVLNKPSTLLLDAGTVSISAASTMYSITINQSLSPGLYWLAFNMQTAGTGNNNFQGNSSVAASSPTGLIGDWGTSTFTGTQFLTGYNEASITGAFTNAGTLTRNISSTIIAGLRY
jgi:hypothetical protein